MDGTLNGTHSMIITNHFILRILVDEGSAFNMIYFRIFSELGLRKQDLRLCEGHRLLAFNDSFTHSCGHVYLPVSLGEGNNKRMANICFFVIPWESVYHSIFGRPFLATIDTMACHIHLKINYHDDSGKPILVKANLLGAHKIQEVELKNPLLVIVITEGRSRETDGALSVIDLNVHKGKPTWIWARPLDWDQE